MITPTEAHTNKDDTQDETVIIKDNKPKKMVIFRIMGRGGTFTDFDDYVDNWCSPTWKSTFESLRTELQHAWKMINYPQNRGTDDCPFYPPLQQVFRWADLTPLPTIKVVILGQDPYPGTDNGLPQACGLAFSVHKGMKIPSSLKNIFTKLIKQYPDIPKPTHGDLTSWAMQGVLLLNTALTCKPSAEGSHVKFYKGFVDKLIRAIVRVNPNCIFLLWGAKAQAAVPDSIQGIKFKCSHPSGISYADTRSACGMFKDNTHFIKTNNELIKIGLNPIDWSLPE